MCVLIPKVPISIYNVRRKLPFMAEIIKLYAFPVRRKRAKPGFTQPKQMTN